jgi:hypothetical protein
MDEAALHSVQKIEFESAYFFAYRLELAYRLALVSGYGRFLHLTFYRGRKDHLRFSNCGDSLTDTLRLAGEHSRDTFVAAFNDPMQQHRMLKGNAGQNVGFVAHAVIEEQQQSAPEAINLSVEAPGASQHLPRHPFNVTGRGTPLVFGNQHLDDASMKLQVRCSTTPHWLSDPGR